MKQIGILSDTHGYLHPRILEHFADCDEIWHAGDIGNLMVSEELKKHKPLFAVYGNIDDHVTRMVYPLVQRFKCEEVNVLMTHIGGYPRKYAPQIKSELYGNTPDIFVCGHSHILKIMNDPILKLLHINPGGAGISGFHSIITIVKITIDGKRIFNCQVIEIEKKMA